MHYANYALTKQGNGGLVCSLSENMFKTPLVLKVNNFLGGDEYVSREGTTCVGKMHSTMEENVIAMSEKVLLKMLFLSFYPKWCR